MRIFKGLIISILISCAVFNAHTQVPGNFDIYPDTLIQKRLNKVLIIEGAAIVSSTFLLYQLWYKDYPLGKFHFINDTDEWLRMDKAGHLFSTYTLNRYNYAIFRWTGLDENKAILYSSLYSVGYLTLIEILDGFSTEWGFSMSDILANSLGSAVFVSQQLIWHEQRISLKYSFHPTQYSDYRPDIFGSNIFSQVFKDYNGSTLWISANIHSFLKKESKFPKWFNIAFGYGAEGMTGGDQNYTAYDGRPIPPFIRRSQFYLALDIDLTKIPTNSKFLHLLFNTLSFIKIPLPTIEYNKVDGLKFHPVYF